MAARDYGQYCGVTRAVELVGERWALLIVRDLLVGPRRFSDLRRNLQGIPPNLLSERLRFLAAEGLVVAEELRAAVDGRTTCILHGMARRTAGNGHQNEQNCGDPPRHGDSVGEAASQVNRAPFLHFPGRKSFPHGSFQC